ncbi:hypothetical protein B0T24DRAFT_346377 [Lasiosphaeria ovina]|uniref:Uncharacterized protein n=1 Tax=Lasiosphaeria ovina TaxID=92902 RepID=A0AAE0K3I2_9PEZI|nr:hypothetical protein B0T24DRAFT_346377 [Lasiosphaeria ovina]
MSTVVAMERPLGQSVLLAQNSTIFASAASAAAPGGLAAAAVAHRHPHHHNHNYSLNHNHNHHRQLSNASIDAVAAPAVSDTAARRARRGNGRDHRQVPGGGMQLTNISTAAVDGHHRRSQSNGSGSIDGLGIGLGTPGRGDDDADSGTASPSAEPSKKRQKRNKPTLSCFECVERKTKTLDCYSDSSPPHCRGVQVHSALTHYVHPTMVMEGSPSASNRCMS